MPMAFETSKTWHCICRATTCKSCHKMDTLGRPTDPSSNQLLTCDIWACHEADCWSHSTSFLVCIYWFRLRIMPLHCKEHFRHCLCHSLRRVKLSCHVAKQEAELNSSKHDRGRVNCMRRCVAWGNPKLAFSDWDFSRNQSACNFQSRQSSHHHCDPIRIQCKTSISKSCAPSQPGPSTRTARRRCVWHGILYHRAPTCKCTDQSDCPAKLVRSLSTIVRPALSSKLRDYVSARNRRSEAPPM